MLIKSFQKLGEILNCKKIAESLLMEICGIVINLVKIHII
jgi:hypothetical protein